jgi:hypothetical protein
LYFFFVCPKEKVPKRKGSRSLGLRLPCAARKVLTPRDVANAPPSRLTALCCAAQLREMAHNKNLFLKTSKSILKTILPA